MTQETIAIAIVISTAVYAIYKIYKSLTTKEKSACGGCSCGSKKELFKQINKSAQKPVGNSTSFSSKMTFINTPS